MDASLTVAAAGPGLWTCAGIGSWSDFAEGLISGTAARPLRRALADAPAPALFWECSPVSSATRHTPFGCLLARASGLDSVSPDPRPLAGRLTEPVNTFWNLGHDAQLVAPAPPGDFAHLAAFCRMAPPALQQALWRQVGSALLAWWARTDDPVWVNTSGLGVAWLHVRLDARPKYYTQAALRRWPL